MRNRTLCEFDGTTIRLAESRRERLRAHEQCLALSRAAEQPEPFGYVQNLDAAR